MKSDSVVPARRDGNAVLERADSVVLLNPDRLSVQQQALILIGSAFEVWAAVDERRTIVEICELLGERYGKAASELEHDVFSLLVRLQSLGFVEFGDVRSVDTQNVSECRSQFRVRRDSGPAGEQQWGSGVSWN
ncbi:PqqD family protein [Demequina mangrovi]|uniref:PqqD family protein n=1 Tax=Demequina mangrovi TaxID=1043493 RepID=UPI001377C1FA|nr:PqqD family protein [Demequina mangrovi]